MGKLKFSLLVFTLPNYFLGNQLQLIFTGLNDLFIPIWKNYLWIIGYAISVILAILFIVVIYYLQFSKKRGRYVDDIITMNLGEVFSSQKLSINYSRVQVIFDFLMSIVLIIPSHHKFVQIGIWLLCEIFYFAITMRMKPFKDKTFMFRTNLVNILFVLLAISILILIQTKENHQVLFSMGVTLINGLILVVDMILSMYMVVADLYQSLKKRKMKKSINIKGKNKIIMSTGIETLSREDANIKIVPIKFDSSSRNINAKNQDGKMKKSKFGKKSVK